MGVSGVVFVKCLIQKLNEWFDVYVKYYRVSTSGLIIYSMLQRLDQLTLENGDAQLKMLTVLVSNIQH